MAKKAAYIWSQDNRFLDKMLHSNLYQNLFGWFPGNKSNTVHFLCLMQIEVSTIISQAGVTLSSLVSRTQDLVSKLKALHLDRHEFVCLKYLVLFNPGELFFCCC